MKLNYGTIAVLNIYYEPKMVSGYTGGAIGYQCFRDTD